MRQRAEFLLPPPPFLMSEDPVELHIRDLLNVSYELGLYRYSSRSVTIVIIIEWVLPTILFTNIRGGEEHFIMEMYCELDPWEEFARFKNKACFIVLAVTWFGSCLIHFERLYGYAFRLCSPTL